jgi:hypothetical protein
MPELHQSSDQQPLYNELALRAMGIDELQCDIDQLSTENLGPEKHSRKTPKKVVIGFVDYGFDLLHPCLLDAAGRTSRFKFLWDQNRNAATVRQPQFALAAAYDYAAHDLNQFIVGALEHRVAACSGSTDDDVARNDQVAARAALDAIYDPHANYYGRVGVTSGAHGTLMASMAAGTAFAGFRSPAPFADLIGVQLAVADTDWREETSTGEPSWHRNGVPSIGEWDGWRTYDSCPQIVHAIHYIYDRASQLGAELVIINLSIGTWAGAHDGQSPVEQAMVKVIGYGRRCWQCWCRSRAFESHTGSGACYQFPVADEP